MGLGRVEVPYFLFEFHTYEQRKTEKKIQKAVGRIKAGQVVSFSELPNASYSISLLESVINKLLNINYEVIKEELCVTSYSVLDPSRVISVYAKKIEQVRNQVIVQTHSKRI